jgi:hypothetical protein
MNASEASVLSRLIPGFGSYASEQKRRDDDLAVRRYLIERLQGTKKQLQVLSLPLVERGQFDAIRQAEQLRSHIEQAQSKLRSATEGYSSWFESNRVDASKLKDVVDLDNDLVGFIDKLDSLLVDLSPETPDFRESIALIDRFKERFARRKEILSK